MLEFFLMCLLDALDSNTNFNLYLLHDVRNAAKQLEKAHQPCNKKIRLLYLRGLITKFVLKKVT